MKWFTKIMERRAPKYRSDSGFVWPLLETRWFGLALVMRYRSDTSFDQKAESNRIRFVLQGAYLEHRELARLGDREPAEPVPKDAFRYSNEFGLWACVTRSLHSIGFERAGRRGGVELLNARNTEDRLVDFAQWMEPQDVIYDAERPVVFLKLVWGGVWR